MPNPRKPADRRQGRATADLGEAPDELAVVATDGDTGTELDVVKTGIPAAQKKWLKKVRLAWEALWLSPLGRYYVPTDLLALEHLFSLYDLRERAERDFRRSPMIVGSQGQLVLHPQGRQMLALDAEIRQLEDRFGLTPRARLALGIQLGEAKRTLDDINREAFGEDEDPR